MAESITVPSLSSTNPVLDAALLYIELGYRVLPLHTVAAGRCTCGAPTCGSAGKHPKTPHGVKDASADLDQARAWFSGPAANIGIATGGGLFVVDIDAAKDPGGRQPLQSYLQKHSLPETYTVVTGNGWHLYYTVDESCQARNGKLGNYIDFRGEGGYVVAPPSVHHTGRLYCVDPDYADVAPVPLPQEFLAALAAPAPAPIPIPPPAPAPAPQNLPQGYAAARQRDYDRRLERGRALARSSKTAPAVSGDHGHDAAWQVAQALVRGLELSEEDAYTVFAEEYNSRCTPPWTDKEIRHKIQSAATASRLSPGYLLEDRPSPGVLPWESTPSSETSDLKVPTLRSEAFHGPLGRLVQKLAPTIETCPEALLFDALALVGNFLNTVSLKINRTVHRTNLYVLLTGSTGAPRKSSGEALILGVIDDITAEAAIDPTLPPVQTPWLDRIKKSVETPQALVELLHDDRAIKVRNEEGKGYHEEVDPAPDRRLVLNFSEGSWLLAKLADKTMGTTFSGHLRVLWDGGKIENNTKTEALRATATDAHVSILTSIPTTELRALLPAISGTNGFSNRFLFCRAYRSRLLARPDTIDQPDLAPEIAALRAAFGWCAQGREYRLRDFPSEWDAIYQEIETATGEAAAFSERDSAYLVRLSILYAALDCSPVVQSEHLAAARAILDHSVAVRLSALDTSSYAVADISETEAKIISAVEEAGDGLSCRDILRRKLAPNKHVLVEQILPPLMRAGKLHQRDLGRRKGVLFLGPPPSGPLVAAVDSGRCPSPGCQGRLASTGFCTTCGFPRACERCGAIPFKTQCGSCGFDIPF